MANKLKYLSIKDLIGSPYFLIKPATKKKRALLLTALAKMNSIKLILNAPALIVNNLNGIGVNPAVNTIIKLYSSYKLLILLNASSVNPGMWSKKKICK